MGKRRANYHGFMSAQARAGFSKEESRARYFALKELGYKPGKWHGSGSRVEYLKSVHETRLSGGFRKQLEFSSVAAYVDYYADYDGEYETDEWVSSLDYKGKG